jgi:putative ABC transport system substrate-binding protein
VRLAVRAALSALPGMAIAAGDFVKGADGPFFNRDTKQLSELAAKAGLPTVGGHRESAQQGLLVGYGPSLTELRQQVASYVERILNGAQAGELPFQGPTRLDFVINLKTAKALRLTIPPSVLVGATETID